VTDMDRAGIERLFDETIAAAHLGDRISAADRQRIVSGLQRKQSERDAGVIDFVEERAIKMELEFLRRIDREYPGWTDLRWNGEQWIVTMPSGNYVA
jgi:hypothetical protein